MKKIWICSKCYNQCIIEMQGKPFQCPVSPENENVEWILLEEKTIKEMRFKTQEELIKAFCDIYDHKLKGKSLTQKLAVELLWNLSNDREWKAYSAGELWKILDPIIDEITNPD